jgi:hypothetical protein
MTRNANPSATRTENGMYVVINRTFEEAKIRVSLHRAKLNERMFFSKLSWHCLGLPCGTETLGKRLQSLCCAQIRTQISLLKEELSSIQVLRERLLLELDSEFTAQQRRYLKSFVSNYQSIKYHNLLGKDPYFDTKRNSGVYPMIFICGKQMLLKQLTEGYCSKLGKASAIKTAVSYHKILNRDENGCYPRRETQLSYTYRISN